MHHQCRQSNIEKPTRCNNNNLLISKISSACFGQSFAHLQERKTEIYSMWYSVLWFLATDTEVPGSIPGATRFSE